MRLRVALLSVLLAGAALGGCTTSTVPGDEVLPELSLESASIYRLGPGDKIKITVFGQADESGQFDIDNQGALSYPLLGRVKVQGMSLEELQRQLTAELDKNFIVSPKITVEVLAYRPFYIYGEVQRPGSYPYVSGLTVRRAVAIAGGFTRRARFEPATVVRETTDGLRKYRADLDVPVQPGDSVEIARRLF